MVLALRTEMDNDDLDSDLEIIEESTVSCKADGRYTLDDAGSKQKYSLLESVSECFNQNRREMAKRIEAMRTKREVEVAHSQYLRNEVVSREELTCATPVVNAWAQKHDKVEKATKRAALSKERHFNSLQRNGRGQPPYEMSPRFQARHSPSTSTNGHSSTSLGRFASYDPALNADVSETFECPVVNCRAWYASRDKFRAHKLRFSHSPCNPCLSLADCELPQRPQFFICPKCGDNYQRRIECQEHMIMNDHLSLFSPLAIVAFACPQCLGFYDDQARCSQHMAKAHHNDVALPFSGDFDRAESNDPFTIPIPQSLAEDFILKCAEAPFSVMCTECNVPITDSNHMKQHEQETKHSHVLSSFADSTPCEIFSTYVSVNTCTSCDQILQPVDFVADCHLCARGLSGRKMELDCKTMKEFVRRVGLTLEQNASGDMHCDVK